MMCLCENNRFDSWQIQIGENETLRFLVTYGTHHCKRNAKAYEL